MWWPIMSTASARSSGRIIVSPRDGGGVELLLRAWDRPPRDGPTPATSVLAEVGQDLSGLPAGALLAVLVDRAVIARLADLLQLLELRVAVEQAHHGLLSLRGPGGRPGHSARPRPDGAPGTSAQVSNRSAVGVAQGSAMASAAGSAAGGTCRDSSTLTVRRARGRAGAAA